MWSVCFSSLIPHVNGSPSSAGRLTAESHRSPEPQTSRHTHTHTNTHHREPVIYGGIDDSCLYHTRQDTNMPLENKLVVYLQKCSPPKSEMCPLRKQAICFSSSSNDTRGALNASEPRHHGCRLQLLLEPLLHLLQPLALLTLIMMLMMMITTFRPRRFSAFVEVVRRELSRTLTDETRRSLSHTRQMERK